MLPSQSKRKLTDDNNPLLNAAKRAKKESKAAVTSNKRKLLNAEEQPGGLLIVRGARTSPPLSLQPVAGPSTTTKPPSKKLRSGSSPPRTISSSQVDDSVLDHQIENDVRAMEDETDHLRRNSRAPTMVDPAHSTAHGLNTSPPVSSFPINPAFQFPPPSGSKNTIATSNGKFKGKARSTNTQEIVVDVSLPLPADETPQNRRNKRLRAGAMSQLTNGNGGPEAESGRSGGAHHRRRSSIGRGKRVSTSFASTGVITQPHNSVSDSSFYKHIDYDLPESERIRQLLIWCSSRAASSSSPSATSSDPAGPSKPLPALSAAAAQVFKTMQDDVLHMLAERRVDLNLYGSSSSPSDAQTLSQAENAQNLTNRRWEVTYQSHIERASAEDEAWKKVTYAYETYGRDVRTAIEKRRAATAAVLSSLPVGFTQEELASQTSSAKAKGKQRAGPSEKDPTIYWNPREHELSPRFRAGVALAKAVLNLPSEDEEPDVRIGGPSSSQDPSGTGPQTGIGNRTQDKVEAELARRIAEVEYKLDYVRSRASGVRTMAEVAEEVLDVRFGMLARVLALRGVGVGMKSEGGGGGADVLRTYVRGTRSDSGSGTALGHDHEPMEMLRALARVDRERPPSMVGDAARRAVREVQRVEESGGVGVIGERRLTGVPVPAVGTTPRKAPGTPRRGTTPSRERER